MFKIALFAAVSIGLASPAERRTGELWKAPASIDSLDLFHGNGGPQDAPKPPFSYVEDVRTGTNKKVLVRDARDRLWEVKFGSEAKPEVFASRLAWALGYYTEPAYYVFNGHISYRAFEHARFEYRDPALKFRPELAWSWEQNPFTGRPELGGLQILVMLLSDWDNKDSRNSSSNTGVLEDPGGRLLYYINDWGGSMGRWGGVFTRAKWDCEGFARQSEKFIKGVEGNRIDWGFHGQHGGDFKRSATVEHVRWLMRYLGRLRDTQLAAALRSAGADDHEIQCFTKSIRNRIEQLRAISARPQPVLTRAAGR